MSTQDVHSKQRVKRKKDTSLGIGAIILGSGRLRVVPYILGHFGRNSVKTNILYKFAREFFQKNSVQSFRVRAKSDKIAKFPPLKSGFRNPSATSSISHVNSICTQ